MRILYFPVGPLEIASSRLRVWKIIPILREIGHTVEVYGRGTFVQDYDVLMFQKTTSQDAIEYDRRIIFDCDDWIKTNMISQLANAITVDTPYKLALYPTATVVPDVLDVEENAPYKTDHREALTQVVWVGNGENTHHLKFVIEACSALQIKLVIISTYQQQKVNWRTYARDQIEYAIWDRETVDTLMIQSDICVCPFAIAGADDKWVLSKSANRPLKAWALGLSVIGTPIPAYVDTGVQYLATTTDEWIAAIEALRSKSARIADAERGKLLTLPFRAEVVAEQWMKVFEGSK